MEMTYGLFDDENHFENLNLYDTPTPGIFKAYLLGVLHDATVRKYTYRISQKSKAYVLLLANMLIKLGYKAWIYKEGKKRNVFVVEFARRILETTKVESLEEKAAYARGYFDSEGGVPLRREARYYIYFSQKNLQDLEELKSYLLDLGLFCGKTHNPSKEKDPEYYRFYILSKSHNDFASIVGSWHPEKSAYLRMKI